MTTSSSGSSTRSRPKPRNCSPTTSTATAGPSSRSRPPTGRWTGGSRHRQPQRRLARARGQPDWGRILTGPEYLTVFDGLTGAETDTVNFIPGRHPLNGRGGVGGNGGNDSIGTRADRPGIAVAYLNGRRPSLAFLRGMYGRSVLVSLRN